MSRFQFYSQKILAWLHVRTTFAGLEISDQVLRLVYFDGSIWQLYAARLEPDVLEGGKIKDKEKFLASLQALKASSKIGKDSNRKISVVVSISSANIYSQVIALPNLTGDNLAKAVDLNLRMASPEELAKMYSSWQVVGKNETNSNLEILSSVVDKELVDNVVEVLLEAGFLAVIVEPRPLALTRILQEKGSGIDAKKAYLLVSVDNAGMDFLVIRNNKPYFEYTNRWQGIVDKNGEIALEKFENELTASLRQILTYYGQHWSDPIAAVIISAVTLRDDIERIVAATASLPTARLTLEMGQPISSEWMVGIGCNLRGIKGEGETAEINLLGAEWENRVFKEQILRFFQFWRVLVPIAFAVLVVMFALADGFVTTVRTSFEGSSGLGPAVVQQQTITQLQASSTAFNNEVALIRNVEALPHPAQAALSNLQAIANPIGVVISHFVFNGAGVQSTITGTASSEDRVIAFKQALTGDSHISALNLPITGVQNNGGVYSFNVTFVYNE